jgi:hypothetical protein
VDLLAQIGGIVVTVACAGLVVLRAATSPAPPPLRHASPAERARFATSVAVQEEDWRAKSADDFPSDIWSQRDAFHGHESAKVTELAKGARVPIEEVLRAIDDDVHKNGHGVNRCAGAVPVHPRPIFD